MNDAVTRDICTASIAKARDRKIDLSDDDVHVLPTVLHDLYPFNHDDEHHFCCHVFEHVIFVGK